MIVPSSEICIQTDMKASKTVQDKRREKAWASILVGKQASGLGMHRATSFIKAWPISAQRQHIQNNWPEDRNT
jgi:hypothetical protein